MNSSARKRYNKYLKSLNDSDIENVKHGNTYTVSKNRLQQYANFRRIQSGSGVLTRRQVRDAEAQSQNVSEINEVSENLPSPTNIPEQTEVADVNPEHSPDQMEVQDVNQIEVPDQHILPESEQNTDQTAVSPEPTIFNRDTLIAENDDLAVYVVKTHFKRQKIFAFDDHQVSMS